MAVDDKEIKDLFESEVSPQKVDVERIRRMKELMRRLNKEELSPQKKSIIPEVRARTMIMVASLAAVVLFSMSALYNYNQFVELRESVLSAGGGVEASLQRRSNLFVNLVNVALNHAQLEEDIFGHVADVRTRIDSTRAMIEMMARSGAGGVAAVEGAIKPNAATLGQMQNSVLWHLQQQRPPSLQRR